MEVILMDFFEDLIDIVDEIIEEIIDIFTD